MNINHGGHGVFVQKSFNSLRVPQWFKYFIDSPRKLQTLN